MLPELVAEDGGVEPVEREVAPVDQLDQRVEHLGLVADLVAKAEVLLALDQTDRLHVFHTRHPVRLAHTQKPRQSPSPTQPIPRHTHAPSSTHCPRPRPLTSCPISSW